MTSKQQYKSTKLSTKFPVKDKTDFQHINTVAYYGVLVKDAMITMLERQQDAFYRESKTSIVSITTHTHSS